VVSFIIFFFILGRESDSYTRSINDLDGPKIADTFYEHLFKDCDPNSSPPVLPDLRQAAKALHLAVAKLRQETDIPLRRWVPFVHYGL
jgi:hypothetical protein